MTTHQRGVWTVTVGEQDEFIAGPFDVFFRTTIRIDRPCELFSLMPKGVDSLLVQLQLFEDGFVHSETYVPSVLQINPAEKRVFVGIIKYQSIRFANEQTARNPPCPCV